MHFEIKKSIQDLLKPTDMEEFDYDIRLIFAIINGNVSTAINRKLHQNFKLNGIDLTPEQWTVLFYLWEKDGVTQQDICNATFNNKPSMTHLINHLEKVHLVVRIPDKEDKRMNLIHLTKEGKALKKRSKKVSESTLKEGLRGISVEDMRISQEVLRKIFSNIKE